MCSHSQTGRTLGVFLVGRSGPAANTGDLSRNHRRACRNPAVRRTAGPQCAAVFRYGEFQRLLSQAGLVKVAVEEHATTYSVPDTETLWRGGLGSFVLTGAAIRHQDEATQDK